MMSITGIIAPIRLSVYFNMRGFYIPSERGQTAAAEGSSPYGRRSIDTYYSGRLAFQTMAPSSSSKPSTSACVPVMAT